MTTRRLLALALGAALALASTASSAASARTDIRGTGSANEIVGTATFDSIRSLGGDDRVIGRAGPDSIDGGRGDDELRGGADGDSLSGGRGDDLVVAGRGADAPSDGPGQDVVRAGAGSDIVVAAGDGQRDVFHCGPGRDLLATYGFQPDAVDVFRGCERFDSSCRPVAPRMVHPRVACTVANRSSGRR